MNFYMLGFSTVVLMILIAIGIYFFKTRKSAVVVPKPEENIKPEDRLAKVIKIVGSKAGFIQLAEVQVFDANGVNVSHGKTATQSAPDSGAPEDVTFSAIKAIDGDTNGIWGSNTFTSAYTTTSIPFWSLELGTPTSISKIVVWYRQDGDEKHFMREALPVLNVINSSGKTLTSMPMTVSNNSETFNFDIK